MRISILMLSLLPLLAQQAPEARKERPAPKNLKLLKPAEVGPAMRSYTVALGVKCDFCHAMPDFASDEKEHKVIARHMIEMAREINKGFDDGKEHVTCYTCHRGAEEPATAPPAATDAPNQAPK